MTPAWRTIYVVLGVAALVYAIYSRMLISGIALIILIVAGVLLILKGLAAR